MSDQLPIPFRESAGQWIVKANSFVNARYNWSLNETRVVLLMISRVRREDNRFVPIRVPVKEIMEEFEINDPSLYGQKAYEFADKLHELKFEVYVNDKEWEKYSVVSTSKYKNGHLELQFDDNAAPFLLNLKNKFTKYGLRWVKKFTSPYTHRVYEMCKQYDDIGHRTITLEDFRTALAIEDKYDRFYDLRRWVIDPAVEEINDHSDLLVSYDKKKKGRRIHALKFTIRKEIPLSGENQAQDQQPKRILQTQSLFDEPDGDAFTEWFEGLPKERQIDLEREAKEALRDKLDKEVGPANIQFEIIKYLRNTYQESWK